jgi:hypothetical protein
VAVKVAFHVSHASRVLTFDSAVTGLLKGYDQLLNLVLDEVEEELQGELPLTPYPLQDIISCFIPPQCLNLINDLLD